MPAHRGNSGGHGGFPGQFFHQVRRQRLIFALQSNLKSWAEEYAPVHAVAYWEDRQRRSVGDHDQALEDAAKEAERLLAFAGEQLAPQLLESCAAAIWEDQDECLEVQPEDIPH